MPKQRKSMRNVNKGNSKIPKIEVEENAIETEKQTIVNKDGHETDSTKSEIEIPEFPDKSQEIFYKLTADTSFCLPDKKIIRINKGMFYINAKSDAIYQMLFSPSKDDVIEIIDIDSTTFKLFLDCVMGFIPYTIENVLTIFRTVWKSQIEKSIQDCINILEPKTMNEESVCNCLNIAVSCKCEVLVKKIIDYLYNVYNPYRFLKNQAYCFLLEPDSLVEILKVIDLDSTMMKMVILWGRNYLEKTKKYNSIKELSEAYNLKEFFIKSADKFGVPYFENLALDYNHFLADVFSDRVIISTILNSKNVELKKNEWKSISKECSFTEKIIIDSVKCHKRVNLLYKLTTNFVIFYCLPHDDKVFCADIFLHGEIIANLFWNFPKTERNRYTKCFATNELCVKGDIKLCDKLTFEIKYKFMCDCSILLVSKSNDLNELYFTKSITLTGVS